MAAVHLFRPPIFAFVVFLFFLNCRPVLSVSDTELLLKLKQSFTNAKSLDSWSSETTTPCEGKTSWVGVLCYNGVITGLRLGEMGLSGNIDVKALEKMPGLRSVSFTNNAFSGPLPKFNRLGALKAIYLTGNKFSGEIPSDYFAGMSSLKKVWLANNEFMGEIPVSLAKLKHLIEVHLEDNKFTGKIPSITQATLTSFNVSNNDLKGGIPSSLSKFNMSSFTGNAGLCGKQLGKVCDATLPPQELELPDGGGLDAAIGNALPAESPESKMGTGHATSAKVALASITFIVVVLSLVIAAIVVIKRRRDELEIFGGDLDDPPVDVYVTPRSNRKSVEQSSWKGMESSRKSSSHSTRSLSQASKASSQNNKAGGSSNGEAGVGDLIIVNDEKGIFGLPDLMKAAAEVLGNGGLGSAYKAVMSSGVAVVVKRMREMNRIGKEGFDAEMRQLGRLRHRNILTPLAYHYRKEEKLMIYEFVPKGSLLYLLHGDKGPCHAELDWPVRLKIVRGIVHGMSFLHNELSCYELPHGNLKSSNIFLGSEYEPLLSDYGLCAFVSPNHAAQALFAYRAPESQQNRQISPKCDVYCLGIVILEILTGKFPSQYLNNGKGGIDVVQWVLSAISENREIDLFDPEIAQDATSLSEMERLLHVGAACVDHDPVRRLGMKDAIRRIEDIHVEEDSRGGIQVAPSLRDGYGDLTSRSHTVNVREGYGELSSRRSSRESNSGRRESSSRRRGDEDSFEFAIS
ncbi:hypothetical protein GIB67_030502 [Kingdonia uniflora]|uniref:Protein kinase domain-containing protein n=1 Tax=Kingdonia uniflora TaxID=39325 RepID=A0A7J7MC89_9MAGN|nr:hypothetical protein GIB67_030502 [Kingdonia uniflora]